MILSDKDIVKAVESGEIMFSPFNKRHVQPASVDLTLANIIRVFDEHQTELIDVRDPSDISKSLDLGKNGTFIIHPSDFILGATLEKITIPSHLAAKIEGRSSLGRLGLIIHTSASYIAPGFSGSLTLEIANISRIPIKLYSGMRIAQIIFEVMSSPVSNPYGTLSLNSKYQGQSEPTASRVWEDFESL